MKILLIGHSILDHFETDNSDNIKPGGLFYSSLGINSVRNEFDTIYLLTSMQKSYFSLFEIVYKNFDLTFVNYTQNMPEVVLLIHKNKEREEVYKNIGHSLIISPQISWNVFNGILINMITGFDISLEQLKNIRAQFSGVIYFDVHTLCRGIDNCGNRIFRMVENVDEWLGNVDILQCNQEELKTLSIYDEWEAAKSIISKGVKILIVTKAQEGAVAYFTIDGEMKTLCAKPISISSTNNVGCGDIFGSVFFYTYISTQNIELSLKRAVIAGTVAAATSNLHLKTKIEIE